ncbi:MAG TPA: hypothetical protein VIM75_14385 [Ohtaekwangia sp.]|uniref:hypothetical protein n=1 Tax=Ohtaekwangia sp. TaxID=2066019 RepID=UPI002F955830
MTYNKEDFYKHVATIVPKGFNMVKDSCMFERLFSDRKEIIHFSHNDYFPHGVFIKGVIVKTYYNKVEELMMKAFHDTGIERLHGDTGTITQLLTSIEDVNYQILDTEISNNVTFDIVAIELKKIVEKGAFPFFEYYKTLQVLYEETEKMELEKMADFIGQPLPFRRMIIKKLCNDPGYNDYYRMVVDFYRSEDSKDDVMLAEYLNRLLQ